MELFVLLFAGIMTGINITLARYLGNKLSAQECTLVISGGTAATICIFALLTDTLIFPTGLPLVCLILAGMLFAAANIFNFMAFKKIDLSMQTIVTRLTLVLIVVLGIFLFGEQINNYKKIGIAVIILATTIVGIEKVNKDGSFLGIFYCLLHSITLALGCILIKYAQVLSPNIPNATVSFCSYLFQVPPLLFTCSLITTLKEVFNSKKIVEIEIPRLGLLKPSLAILVLVISLIGALAWSSNTLAIKLVGVGIAMSSFEGLITITCFLTGILLFKEKVTIMKVFGLLLGICGIGLLYFDLLPNWLSLLI